MKVINNKLTFANSVLELSYQFLWFVGNFFMFNWARIIYTVIKKVQFCVTFLICWCLQPLGCVFCSVLLLHIAGSVFILIYLYCRSATWIRFMDCVTHVAFYVEVYFKIANLSIKVMLHSRFNLLSLVSESF